jgi:hypothetical protein
MHHIHLLSMSICQWLDHMILYYVRGVDVVTIFDDFLSLSGIWQGL